MPTIAIAWPISRLPYQSRSWSSIDLFNLGTLEPPARVHPHSRNCADDCQRKEKSEDNMGHHQHAVDTGNSETECDLISPPTRRSSRVSHHVERVKDESDTSHRYKARFKRSVKKQTSQRRLCRKAAEPPC